MLEKVLILGVAVAGFATAVVLPMSAEPHGATAAAVLATSTVTTGISTTTICPAGSSNPNYCVTSTATGTTTTGATAVSTTTICPAGSTDPNYCVTTTATKTSTSTGTTAVSTTSSSICQHLRIEALRQQLAQWEGAAPWRQSLEDPASLERVPALSSGCPALDRALPEKGFRPGTLVEWLCRGEGDGTATLAFRAAAGACVPRRACVAAGRWSCSIGRGEFYPLAAVAQGIEPARLIVVHPGNKADHTWALDQALRCPAVAAVVAWPESLDGKLDGRTFRRLQLAAEQGGGLGLLIRPESVRCQPSWADVRLLVEPLPSTSPYGRRRARCTHGDGCASCSCVAAAVYAGGEQTVEVEIDHETHPLPED